MQDISGFEPKMWGSSIIGFGQYHYKSERSTQEGDWPLVGFSPRKAAISLYVYSGCSGQDDLLKELGKFKSCVEAYSGCEDTFYKLESTKKFEYNLKTETLYIIMEELRNAGIE